MAELDEIREIERLAENLKDLARIEVIGQSSPPRDPSDTVRFPIYKVTFGSADPKAPVLGLIGGVHGLERIGAQVCVSLLNSLSQLVLWDRNTREVLERVRIFFVPTVNPWGILRKRRSNPRGVDLMRNAPTEAEGAITPLVGGQRWTPNLPWYRGSADGGIEDEAQALLDACRAEISQAPVSVLVDFHSGFGVVDRIWFPYAKTREPFPDLPTVHAFKHLMERTYPHHFYRIEPQSKNYTTHGDLWDYLYDEYRASAPPGVLLPLTVEMGSWNWVKKNPFQFFSTDGAYNPVRAHRLRRTLRRHNTFFEFLIRAVASPSAWADLSEEQRGKHLSQAMELWYGR